MVDKFLVFIKEKYLFEKNDKILVAVSGGVDSAVLFDLLFESSKKLNFFLAIAHVNYGLRDEADSDQKFVEKLAKEHKVPIFTKKVKLLGSNIEERARIIRYDFFNKLAEKHGFDKIAVAHHKNDLAETMLLNFIRGAGISGLSPMKAVNGKIIRPLLFATKEKIIAYAMSQKIDHIVDKSNYENIYSRNIIRNLIVPEMKKINPNLVQALSQEADLFTQAEIYLNKQTESTYKKLISEKNEGIELDIKRLGKEDYFLQTLVLRKALEKITGSTKDIGKKNIEEIMELMKSPRGTKSLSLPKSLSVTLIYDKMFIALSKQKPLIKGKKTKNLKIGKNIFESHEFELSITPKKLKDNTHDLAMIDIQKTGSLLVRFKEDGDRIAIKNGKTKKLQDVFVDAKTPRDSRNTVPIVVTRTGEVVWIPKLRLSEKFKATSASEKVMTIKYKEII